ncbi:flagellar basal-body rod protein FlgG [Mesoterricola silvestris]|uniref:Flagellar basal-body rod protein FlgG n=1 Tax=Mesoterricola silvestris TaxID=2927979 RepID=A0AA48K9I5_9BACT|nr:flagellar basal-body rod protein FlgG [Mesoterricola silvestris]BDU73521.1 flagellar basal-body rod protein FlgG [Mesoterricola silvestris]
MMRAMWSAAAGMNVQTTNMDTISNNLANINTTGFKKSRAEFQDLLYQTINTAGTNTSTSTTYPGNIQIGHGARLAAMVKEFTTGSLKNTNSQFDMAIEGSGFFRVTMPDGTFAYTRDGSFSLDQNGNIVNANGNPLDPQVTIPQDALSVTIATDGTISVTQPGQSTPQQVGQITISNFINPNGLNAMGHNLYQPTLASGDAIDGTPGLTGLGTIQQYFLEVSNVDMAEEMVNMIIGQRAYEANSKTIQTADSMLQLVAALKR